MKSLCIHFILLFSINHISIGQNVGINTTDPKATLDLKASNQVTPAPYDGLLIPKIDAFPSSNPTSDQNGMLIFLTSDNSFYFWHNTSTSCIRLTDALVAVKKINDLVDGKSDNDGSDNGSSIFIGINAGLNDDMTNNANVGLGFESLKDNISGRYNTSVGYKSLYSNSVGSNNTAIGNFSLYKNQGGSVNTAIGIGSLYENTSGQFNVAVGQYPLYNNLNGRNNTVIGNRAMYFNTLGNDNTAIGNRALFNNSKKSKIVAIGDSALFNNGPEGSLTYQGVENTAVGSKALFSNNQGSKNTALGFESIYSNTTGELNTGLGIHVLFKNTEGTENTAIGGEAMFNNISGESNTATGYLSLYSNNDGNFNVAYGQEAMYNNESGNNNVSIGHLALSGIINGNFNVGVGRSALPTNTNGHNNTALGSYSLMKNLTGSDNVAIGDSTGFNSTGNGNVFLGSNSGFNETGSNKLYVDNSKTNQPLIYGEFDSDLLQINGDLEVLSKIKIVDGTQGADKVLTSDANGVASWEESEPTYVIGINNDLGGYVFYVTPDGKHGLVAATQDQGTAKWNTAQDLISNPDNHNVAGKKFTNWRLPTRYELGLMYVVRLQIGGFPTAFSNPYWCSTDDDSVWAWTIRMDQSISSDGTPYLVGKVNDFLNVRAVREF